MDSLVTRQQAPAGAITYQTGGPMGSALPGLGLPSKADMYAAALEGLVQVNGLVLDKNPSIPPMYESGARWRNIPHDTWRRADQIALEGWGDCEGLSSWRVAELRKSEEDPESRVGVYHTGAKKYHAVVIRGDDNIEDPSVNLGMRPRIGMPATRQQMNLINGMWPKRIARGTVTVGEMDGDSPAAQFVDNPDGSMSGQISLPLGDGTGIIATTSPSADKAIAAAKTANLLADTAATLAKDPNALKKLGTDALMLNPYTAAALALYSQPDINRALKRGGSAGASLLSKLFHRGG